MSGVHRDSVRQAVSSSRLPVLGTVSAHVMVSVAAEYGLTWERCLDGTGITPAVLGDAQGTIRLEQELALARNLVRRLPHVEGLGLVVSRRYRLSVYGVLGWGMLCAGTARDALGLMARYGDLTYACCALSAVERDGEFRVMVDDRSLPGDVRGFFAERSLGAVIRLMDDLLPGGGWLRGVDVARPRPGHARLFDEEFGVPVRFDQPQSCVRVDARALDSPMPMANGPMLRLAEQQCRELLAQRRSRLRLRDGLREHVLRELPDLPSMAGAAAALGMSERTLRRRLAEEDTSFSAIVTGTRRALAEQLLLQRVPPVQVARRLGFAGPAAFTHAFRRWTGCSPREFAARTAAGRPEAGTCPAVPAEWS